MTTTDDPADNSDGFAVAGEPLGESVIDGAGFATTLAVVGVVGMLMRTLESSAPLGGPLDSEASQLDAASTMMAMNAARVLITV